jgi:hypothetical protein
MNFSSFTNNHKKIVNYLKKYELTDIEIKNTIIEKNIGILTNLSDNDSILILITHLMKQNKILKKHRIQYGTPFVCLKDIDTNNTFKSNLIIIKHTMIDEWYSILNKANYKYICLTKNTNLIDLKKNTIILCTDLNYKSVYTNIKNLRWNRIIIHKCNDLKLPNLFSWNCNFIWLTTNNPDILFYSNIPYLYPINQINNYMLFSYLIVNSNNILPSIINSIDIIKCKTIEGNKCINNDIINMLSDKMYSAISYKLNITNINSTIKSEKCVICYSNKKNILQTSCCNQFYCYTCLIKSLHNDIRCPMCRVDINIDKLITNVSYVDTNNKLLTKNEWLEDYIKSSLGRTIYIYKHYHWIEFFNKQKIAYNYIYSKNTNIHKNCNNVLLNILDYNILINNNLFDCDTLIYLDDISSKEEKNINNKLNYIQHNIDVKKLSVF